MQRLVLYVCQSTAEFMFSLFPSYLTLLHGNHEEVERSVPKTLKPFHRNLVGA